ncbi:MAG: hypothetical protein IOD11_18830 [Rhodocyclaceae bacterium]|nr:hypothetical protein [Rhodocyclaceae bacterium]
MANSYGSVTPLTGNANSLANQAFASLGVIDFGSAPPHECFVEVTLAPSSSTPAGPQRAVIFCRSSLDGSNFSVAPSANEILNAGLVGVVSLIGNTTRRSLAFPLSPVFGGALPPRVEIFVQNDCGVAFASSGQGGQYRTETFG